MSEKTRSFFATIPGVVTGLAGLLTAVVGLITLLVQLDVIGGDDSEKVATTATTVTTVTTVVGSGVTPTTEAGTFTVNPGTLAFGPTDAKEKTVTIRNTSATTRLTVLNPRVTGKDADRFTAAVGDCAAPLAPDLSCSLRVTFTPSGPIRSYEAIVQLQASGAPRAAEVKLTASTLL